MMTRPPDPCDDPTVVCSTCYPSIDPDCVGDGGPNSPLQPPEPGGGGPTEEAKVTVSTPGNIPYGQVPGYGQLDAISALVQASTAQGATPTGAVVFSMDPAAVPDSDNVPLYDGSAAWSFGGLGQGPLVNVDNYTVWADYSGDADYADGEGSSTFAVIKGRTIATMTNCPATPISSGKTQSFIVSVTWSIVPTATGLLAPTGKVILNASRYSGGSLQSTGVLSMGYSGTPSRTTIPIALSVPGTYTVTATYQGDDNYVLDTTDPCPITVK